MNKMSLAKLLVITAYTLLIIGFSIASTAPQNVFIGYGFFISAYFLSLSSIFPLQAYIHQQNQENQHKSNKKDNTLYGSILIIW